MRQNFFSPTQSLNAFAVGSEIGTNLRNKQTDAKMAPMIAQGDYKQAAQYAGQRGDMERLGEMKRAIAGMDEASRAEALKRQETIARTAAGLQSVPYEQRKGVLQQSMPALQAMGVDPAMISQFDPTDEGISQVLAQVTPLADLLKGPDLHTLSQGQTLFDDTGQQIAAVDPKPVTPSYGTVTTAEGVTAFNKADPTQTHNLGAAPVKTPLVNNTVNSGPAKAETEFQKGVGKASAGRFSEVFAEGTKARQQIANVDAMEALLDEIDYTGLGGESLLALQRVGAMMGVELGDDLPAKEVAKRISSEMALALKDNLPGPMSDADRQFLISIPPNLSMTAEANDALLYILKKRAEFGMAMEQSLVDSNPQSYQQYSEWERGFRGQYSEVFSVDDRIKLMGMLGTGQEVTPDPVGNP